MSNWYYVQGSERLGPVGEETLRELFVKGDINIESYIWKKGFQNWERLKDVTELDFKSPDTGKRKNDKKEAEAIDESSPELIFHFDWKKVRDEEELFFIKIGLDRKSTVVEDKFGPFSITELKEAIDDKRINNHTLIFSAGMPGWIEIGETPLDPKKLSVNLSNIREPAPLLMVVQHDPLPLVALINKAGIKECTMLGAGAFQTGSDLLCSIYAGSTLKAKNIKVNIKEYSPKSQMAICRIVEINDQAKKIMLNYAE